jgi:type II secretory pathway pseudopilin PulG
MKNQITNRLGNSIIEIIAAVGVFALVSSAITTLILSSFTSLNNSVDNLQASFLAKEGIEASKAIQRRAWNEKTASNTAIHPVLDGWEYGDNEETEQIGNFTRLITFQPIFRDANHKITASSTDGAYLDPASFNTTVTVSWTARDGQTKSITRKQTISDWSSKQWQQNDWSGGGGQAIFGLTTTNIFLL